MNAVLGERGSHDNSDSGMMKAFSASLRAVFEEAFENGEKEREIAWSITLWPTARKTTTSD